MLENRSSYTLKNAILVAMVGILFLILLLTSPFFIPEVVNQYHLKQLEYKFSNVSHPKDSLLLKSVSGMGDTGGSQCCCLSFVAELRQFSGDKQAVEAFYREQKATVWFFKDGYARSDVLDLLSLDYDHLGEWGVFSPEQVDNLILSL